jgi:hypothetical protein
MRSWECGYNMLRVQICLYYIYTWVIVCGIGGLSGLALDSWHVLFVTGWNRLMGDTLFV